MKLALSLIALAAIPASAQLGTVPRSPTPVTAKAAPGTGGGGVPAAMQSINTLEKEMDTRLATTGGNDPCLVLGNTRGLAIPGFGVVFTAELDLVNTPTTGIFATRIPEAQKASVRKRKLDHVPLVQQTMRDIALNISASPVLRLAETDQVVVSVRLMYRTWEDTKDLPGQIVVRIDRRGAAPRVEVQ